MDAVKAQIRHEFISGISMTKSSSRKTGTNDFDFHERVTTSIMYHFMKHRSLSNSISIFVAECGLNIKSSILSEDDIVQLLKFNALRNSMKNLNNLTNRHSVLDKLVEFTLSLNNDKSKDMETQTGMSGPDVRESLDRQILNLRYIHDN